MVASCSSVSSCLTSPYSVQVLAPRDISDWSAGFTMLGLGDM